MTGRSDWRPMAVMLVVALVFGALIYTGVLGPGLIAGGPGDLSASPSPSPSPTASPPDIQLAHETCCEQAARFLQVKWTSNVRVTEATLVLDPQNADAWRLKAQALEALSVHPLLKADREHVAA